MSCDNPCKDPTCRDNADHGFGLHCHHDHRDPGTKIIQDAHTERSAKRELAIEWLTDNLGKVQNAVRRNTLLK